MSAGKGVIPAAFGTYRPALLTHHFPPLPAPRLPPMSPRRNLLVGLTVLLALIFLGYMIIEFGGRLADPFGEARVPIVLDADEAGQLSAGSAVTFKGINVGQVTRVERTADHTILIEAAVDAAPPLPANLVGRIEQTNLLGSGKVVALAVAGDAPAGVLEPGAVIPTAPSGNAIFPPEFLTAADEARLAVAEFRQSGLIENVNAQVAAAGDMVEAVNTLVGDDEFRGQFRDTVENLRSASARADAAVASFEAFGRDDLPALRDRAAGVLETGQGELVRAGDNFDDLSRRLESSLVELDGLLGEARQVAAKINAGQGTAGALVNDDRLYEASLAVLLQMQDAVRDVQRLAQQLEQEGVKLGF